MTHLEGTEGHAGSEPKRPDIEVDLTPDTPADIDDQTLPDGTRTIFLRGEMRIVIHPASSEATESPVTASDVGSSGLVPDSVSSPVSGHYSAADKAPKTYVKGMKSPKPEDADTVHVFTGTLTGEPRKPKRRDGKKVVQFDLAVSPDSEEHEVKQFRVFRQLASHTWNRIQEDETDFQVMAYGPKHWPEWIENAQGKRQKTGEWTAGYYAFSINGVSNQSLEKQAREARERKQ